MEYLQSVEFDRQYYVPIEDYDKFLNDPNLNIENYRNECYIKKQEMNIKNLLKKNMVSN